MILSFPTRTFNPSAAAFQDLELAGVEVNLWRERVGKAARNGDGDSKRHFQRRQAIAQVRWEKAYARRWMYEHWGVG